MARVRKVRRRKVNPNARAEAEMAAALPSRFKQKAIDSANRAVIVGNRLFNVKLSKLLEDETALEIVAMADTARDAMAYPNEFGAELVIVDVELGGPTAGIELARTLNERSPGCAFMLVCGSLTPSIAIHLWVYGTESWSVVSHATAKNASHLAEAASSAVHGMAWVEPGIQRELEGLGKRPRSFDERKLSMFGRLTRPA